MRFVTSILLVVKVACWSQSDAMLSLEQVCEGESQVNMEGRENAGFISEE